MAGCWYCAGKAVATMGPKVEYHPRGGPSVVVVVQSQDGRTPGEQRAKAEAKAMAKAKGGLHQGTRGLLDPNDRPWWGRVVSRAGPPVPLRLGRSEPQNECLDGRHRQSRGVVVVATTWFGVRLSNGVLRKGTQLTAIKGHARSQRQSTQPRGWIAKRKAVWRGTRTPGSSYASAPRGSLVVVDGRITMVDCVGGFRWATWLAATRTQRNATQNDCGARPRPPVRLVISTISNQVDVL